MEDPREIPLKTLLQGRNRAFDDFLALDMDNISGRVEGSHEISDRENEIRKHLAFNYTERELEVIKRLAEEIILGDCLIF